MMRVFPTKILFLLIAVFSLSFAPTQLHDLSITYTTAYASDSDGVDDADDEFPDDPSESSDLDHDGQGDNSDDDRDGDGDANAVDPDPNDPNVTADTTPPVVTAPAAMTLEATGAATTAILGAATATDAVDGVIVPTSDAPASFPIGATTVTYTATDAAGNIGTATQVVTVTDTTAPVVIAPAAVNAQSTDGNPVAVAIGAATATDLFAVTITNDAPATFPVGTTTVTWTATDANGNSSTATQLVTVTASDTTPPVITAPANVSVEATGAATTVAIGTASATDNFDPTVTVTNDAPASFPVGATTVTYTATDAAGNTTTATQTVTISDTTAPAITAPAAVTADSGDNQPVAVTLGAATASDLVDGAIAPTNDAPVTFPVGTTTVTYTATDAAGNSATATQLVTVNLVDVTAPVMTAPAAVSATSGDNQPVTVTLGTATATDLVDGAVVVTNDAPATFPVGTTTVTYTATDAAGNTATATQLVTVNLVDITAPTLTVPADITAEATGANTTVTLGVGFASDLVDGAIIPTSDAPALFPVGVTTVTWTATDAAGNVGTATQVVTITDTTVPVVSAPADVTADSINGTDPVVTLGIAAATDLFAVTITNDAPAIFPVGVTTVVWMATDANGNASAATQLVTVNLIDTLPPVITVPANVYTSTSTSQATVDIGIASANDNIDGIVAVSNDASATYPIGVTTVTYTSSDSAGNTATATQNVYVSYVPTVGGGTGGGTTPPPAGGGATVGMEAMYWHHNDHLGTPQAMTDINGTKVWEMSQTPFGIATVNEDVDGDGLTVENNFRFPGQYYDSETGLFYNYNRTLDPELDRYIQHDPIGLKGGLNPYLYAEANPLSFVDPMGLTSWPTENPSNITDKFGWRTHPVTGKPDFHSAVDFGQRTTSGKVYAVESGKVDSIGTTTAGTNYIKIKDKNNYIHEYFHTSNSYGYKRGDEIKEGCPVGRSDLSGYSTGLHLHYALRTNILRSSRVDPLIYLRQNNARNVK